jgi:hypothetical protein
MRNLIGQQLGNNGCTKEEKSPAISIGRFGPMLIA